MKQTYNFSPMLQLNGKGLEVLLLLKYSYVFLTECSHYVHGNFESCGSDDVENQIYLKLHFLEIFPIHRYLWTGMFQELTFANIFRVLFHCLPSNHHHPHIIIYGQLASWIVVSRDVLGLNIFLLFLFLYLLSYLIIIIFLSCSIVFFKIIIITPAGQIVVNRDVLGLGICQYFTHSTCPRPKNAKPWDVAIFIKKATYVYIWPISWPNVKYMAKNSKL